MKVEEQVQVEEGECGRWGGRENSYAWEGEEGGGNGKDEEEVVLKVMLVEEN